MSQSYYMKKKSKFLAVLLTDCYVENFSPITDNCPVGLISLVNTPILDYSLDWLSRNKVDEVFLYCIRSNYEQFKSHCEAWCKHDYSMTVTVVVSEGGASLGDVMRDIYAKSLIDSDFLLLSGNTIGNLSLCSLMREHLYKTKEDKRMVMTNVYCTKTALAAQEKSSMVKVQMNKTGKLVSHSHVPRRSIARLTVNNVFDETIRTWYQVVDTQVTLCTGMVPSLFSDNFDYCTRDDLIQGLIEQEDILQYTIHAIISTNEYASTVPSLQAYQLVSQAIMNRVVCPSVPEKSATTRRRRYQHHVIYNQYLDRSAMLERESNGTDMVIDAASVIGKKTEINRSVIGKHCIIAQNNTINGSFIMDNVRIESDCKLNNCYVGNRVTILNKVTIEPGVILGDDVVVGPSVTVPRCTKLVASTSPSEFDTEIIGSGGKAALYSEDCVDGSTEPFLVWGEPEEEEAYESSRGSGTEDESVTSLSSSEEREREFDHEAEESLMTAYKTKCEADNVILEINGSRHAYNMSLADVIKTVVRIILTIGEEESVQKLTVAELGKATMDSLNFFQPVLKNYIKKINDQILLLEAIEELVEVRPQYHRIATPILIFFNQTIEVLDDEVVTYWYNQQKPDEHEGQSLRKTMHKFVEWLQEEDSESDSE